MGSCKSYRAVCCTLSIAQDPRIFFEASPCLSRWRCVRRYIQQYNKVTVFLGEIQSFGSQKQSNPLFPTHKFPLLARNPTLLSPPSLPSNSQTSTGKYLRNPLLHAAAAASASLFTFNPIFTRHARYRFVFRFA